MVRSFNGVKIILYSILLLFTFNFLTGETTEPKTKPGPRYLIYDVNPGEGFNLRRDVYIRAANLVKSMIDKGENWILVLPPWSHLYHWQSARYIKQQAIKWKEFFDLYNMNLYVPVIEFEDFVEIEGHGIEHLLYLQRYPDMFDGEWKERIEFKQCADTLYHKDEDGTFRGYFWDIANVHAKKYDCVSVQGDALLLADFLKNLDAKSVFVPRLEEVMHINYGGSEFFRARRSLVFAEHLRNEADIFRLKFLNSTDEDDITPYGDEWTKQIPKDSSARGGPYLAVHMRRGDFTYAHQETIPTIEELASEIKKKLKEYQLDVVYISTDGTDKEIEELHSYLGAVQIQRFPRNKDVVKKFKDGGVAIIDQWVSAHARYFIGTCDSTFSFRIHEERDILGFNPDTTYNCVCGKQSPPDRCEQPTRWRVVFT